MRAIRMPAQRDCQLLASFWISVILTNPAMNGSFEPDAFFRIARNAAMLCWAAGEPLAVNVLSDQLARTVGTVTARRCYARDHAPGARRAKFSFAEAANCSVSGE
jgi:hypothetical protein